MQALPQFYSLADAARLLGFERSTIYSRASQGRMKRRTWDSRPDAAFARATAGSLDWRPNVELVVGHKKCPGHRKLVRELERWEASDGR
jgi:hypothetical protein